MSDLRLKRQVSSVTRLNDDAQWMNLRGTRDGAMISADWLTAMALEGRCFGVNAGTATAPATLRAAYADGEQDLYIIVPDGTTMIPVFIQINFEDTGSVDVVDVMAVASSTYDASVTATATQTIYNMRMDAPYTSGCTSSSAISAGGTACLSGNFIEFWRGNAGKVQDSFNTLITPTNELVARTTWTVRDSLVPPVIVGPGSLNVFASGQAPFGFITAIWVELPSTSIK